MIIRLTPDQIERQWDVIQYGIEHSLPPIAYSSPERMKNIFQTLMEGRMQCWIGMENKPQGELIDIQEDPKKMRKIYGFCITTSAEDYCSGVRNLLIYCVYSFATLVPNEIWLEGFHAISTYAKSLGCHRIVAYTDQARLIHLAQGMLHGDASYTFVSIPVKQA